MRTDRSAVNGILDAVSFLVLVALASSGLLMEYRLGRGTTLLGFAKGEIGEFHLYTGWVFLGLIGAHIGLHFQWIQAMVRGKVEEYKGRRGIIAAVAALVVLGAAASLFLIPLGHRGGR